MKLFYGVDGWPTKRRSPRVAIASHTAERYDPVMSTRVRKLIGGGVMILFVIAYALLAMALAQARAVQDAGKLAQAAFYMLLGLGWIVPLLPLIRWMERPRP